VFTARFGNEKRETKWFVSWAIISQVVVTACVLSLNPDRLPGDFMFRAWLIVYIIRTCVYAPFLVIHHLRPRVERNGAATPPNATDIEAGHAPPVPVPAESNAETTPTGTTEPAVTWTANDRDRFERLIDS
jgi:hypothetical protein